MTQRTDIEGYHTLIAKMSVHQEHNANLIANAPEWLRYLIEHYEECQADAIALDEQVKELRNALEDVADYQHRWSDSPIREVQKIARQALERTKP